MLVKPSGLKAYVAEGNTHSADSYSNLLYVQLFDPQNKLLAERNIQLIDGKGKGDIALPDSLSSGEYQLAAFTKYMLNFDTSFIFTKEIILAGNKVASLDSTSDMVILPADSKQSHSSPPFNVSFFPEGGEIVSGLKNRVAIKANNKQGKGLAVEGKIVNSKGETISWFNTHKFGLGDFIVQPEQANEEFFGIIKYRNQTYTFPLPAVKDKGFGLHIRNSYNKLYIQAEHNQQKDITGAFIIGHVRGKVFAVIEGEKGASQLYAALPTENLPTGIAHFTLFNKSGVPQNERLIFIDNPEEKVFLNVNPDKRTYNTREKAIFSLNLSDTTGQPVVASLSATVVSKDELQGFKNSNNIKSYFLLSSDLKGKIEEPAYYFNEANKDRKYLLDLLMLTHGWRRFTWKEIEKDPMNLPAYLPEKGFTIEGQIYRYFNQDKEISGTVDLTMFENLLFNETHTTTAGGRFRFDNLNFTDTVTFILQANKLRKKDRRGNDNIYIQLKPSQNPVPLKPLSPEAEGIISPASIALTDVYQKKVEKIREIDAAFSLGERDILLQEVSVESKKQQIADPFERAFQLYGTPSNRLVPDSISFGFLGLTIFDLIQGRVPGVQIVGGGLNKQAIIRGVRSINSSIEPLYLLDGMPVDAYLMNTYPVQDVAYIDVLKGADAAFYGSRGSNGVLAVYTKRGIGQVAVDPEIPGITHFNHAGYYLAREFYSPDYAEENPQHAKPDYRSTLYWNPDIVIDENGKAKLEFFTSDEKADYVLLIEGMTPDGSFIVEEETFEVE